MNFKCRASALGQLMTNARSKTESLSQTTKSYLEDWYKEQIYGIKKQIKSKYIQKGLALEDTAIEFYSVAMNKDFMIKNLDHFEDDFFTGTPDCFHEGIVYDFKTSWDCFTFPLFDDTPDMGYYYQLQVYMHLTGLKKAKLVYTLQDTPEFLTYEEPVSYAHVEDKYRIKEFDIEFDPQVIEMAKAKVLECREYLNGMAV
jgi:hypothetical protein